MPKKEKIIRLSLCMIARDEEAFLHRCLKSVRGVVDEIIVLDTGSRDRTPKLAKEFGARVVPIKWDGDRAKTRNIYLREARGDWILVLDADETIAGRDIPKLRSLLGRKDTVGFRLTVREYCDDCNLLRDWQMCRGEYKAEERFSGCKGWVPIPLIRLFQNRKGISYGSCTEHCEVDDSINNINGGVEDAGMPIHHFQCLKDKDYIRKKQLRALRCCLNQSLKKHPNNPMLHYNISIGLFSFKRDDGAIRHLKKAITLNPTFQQAYNLLGMVYLEQGRYNTSITYLNKSLTIDPNCSDTHCLLGIAYDGQGRINEAIKSLKKALQLKPFHPVAHNSLGVCYAKKGCYQEALDEFKRTVEILPNYKDAHYNIKLVKEHLSS